MEVYILDSALRRTSIIDGFESFIWTERFAASGDFELKLASTTGNRALLVTGTRIALSVSFRVMTIETVESSVDTEGRSSLKISGRSLESILESRIAKNSMSNLTAEPKWIITGAPGSIARLIFQRICVDGALSSGDIIPFVIPGNPFPADTIPEPAPSISVELDPDTVYKAIKDICDVYNLGFRLVRDPASNVLYFNVYSGCDRTSAQKIVPSVIFSPNLDNMQDTTELTSVEPYKNVAYVFSKNGFEIVYAQGVDSSTVGFERRVLLVKSDDENAIGATLTTNLRRQGSDELSKNRSLFVFDGKLLPSTDYPYGLSLNVGTTPGSWLSWDTNEVWDDAVGYWDDAVGVTVMPSTSYPYYGSAYNLGDLVEMQSSSGATNYMRVTEQIFASDQEGERSYPTLTLNLAIEYDTWFGWDANQNWDDALSYWDDV